MSEPTRVKLFQYAGGVYRVFPHNSRPRADGEFIAEAYILENWGGKLLVGRIRNDNQYLTREMRDSDEEMMCEALRAYIRTRFPSHRQIIVTTRVV